MKPERRRNPYESALPGMQREAIRDECKRKRVR